MEIQHFSSLINSLYIQTLSLSFLVAVQKINDIIKTEHRSSLNRPSRFTNAPPPLMSLHSGVPSVVMRFYDCFF